MANIKTYRYCSPVPVLPLCVAFVLPFRMDATAKERKTLNVRKAVGSTSQRFQISKCKCKCIESSNGTKFKAKAVKRTVKKIYGNVQGKSEKKIQGRKCRKTATKPTENLRNCARRLRSGLCTCLCSKCTHMCVCVRGREKRIKSMLWNKLCYVQGPHTDLQTIP